MTELDADLWVHELLKRAEEQALGKPLTDDEAAQLDKEAQEWAWEQAFENEKGNA